MCSSSSTCILPPTLRPFAAAVSSQLPRQSCSCRPCSPYHNKQQQQEEGSRFTTPPRRTPSSPCGKPERSPPMCHACALCCMRPRSCIQMLRAIDRWRTGSDHRRAQTTKRFPRATNRGRERRHARVVVGVHRQSFSESADELE